MRTLLGHEHISGTFYRNGNICYNLYARGVDKDGHWLTGALLVREGQPDRSEFVELPEDTVESNRSYKSRVTGCTIMTEEMIRYEVARHTTIKRTTWGDVYSVYNIIKQYCGYSDRKAMMLFQAHVIDVFRKAGQEIRKTRFDRWLNNEFCCNAEPGTYGHECGEPATWIGVDADGGEAGFCDHCKAHGYEARGRKVWRRQEVTE